MTQGDPKQVTQTETSERVLNEEEAGRPANISADESAFDESVSGNKEVSAPSPIDMHERTIPEPAPSILLSSRPAPAQSEGDSLAAQTLARVLKLEEVVRNLVPAQSRRTKAMEDRIDSLQEALMSQVAGIETHYRTAISTTELKLTTQVNLLKSRVDAAEEGRLDAEKRAMEAESEAEHVRVHLDAYRQVWQAAPLTLRLKFIRELLPEDHRLQGVLKEAAALEDLRRRGRDLETWLTNYPSLFADAMQSVESGTAFQSAAIRPSGTKIESVDILALQTLEEAKSTLGGTLQALGITWIAPEPGDIVQSEHEVIGDEVAQQPEGRIASLRRRGFRVQGRVAMPAQVARAVARSEETEGTKGTEGTVGSADQVIQSNESTLEQPVQEAAPTATIACERIAAAESSSVQRDIAAPGQPRPEAVQQAATPVTPITLTGEMPDWLRMLVQRTHGCESQPVLKVVYQIVKLVNLPGQVSQDSSGDSAAGVLAETLTSLIPLLGLRYADGLSDIDAQWGAVLIESRDPLIGWLREKLLVSVLAPVRGQKFDPQTMEAIETRRTVHESENETVSKVDSIGLMLRDRPLVRARVVRYATEGAG